MSENSKIEWTDTTWNPVRGCTKVSPGCKHCYAETFAERWRGIPGHPYEQGFDLRLVPEKLNEPRHWRKPRRVFVNSMSDLLHEGIEFSYIAQIFQVMRECPAHTFQVLTKRAKRMQEWSLFWNSGDDRAHPEPNIWLGVSVEDRKYGLPRIDILRNTPAAVRFLSVEPLLEEFGEIDLSGIHWVIVGGESGPKARPMHPDWARNVREQCVEQGVPFFFKQWGEWGGNGDEMGHVMYHPLTPFTIRASLNGGKLLTREGKIVEDINDADSGWDLPVALIHKLGKKRAGRVLDGRTWDEMPAAEVRNV